MTDKEKAKKLADAFIDFKNSLFSSNATNEEKEKLWKAFLNLFTGHV